MAWPVSAVLAALLAIHGVPVPKGSRGETGVSDRVVSGKGYRDTVAHLKKWLDRQGIPHRRVGPYRARGVDITRFLSDDRSTRWLAIHVYRQAGKTWISVVKRPS